VGESLDTLINAGEDLLISLTVGGTKNQYQWFKNGEEIPEAVLSEYTITDATSDYSGRYHCEITNTVATELTLYGRPTDVLVDDGTSIKKQDSKIPKKYALHQNYPNPFNAKTIINYELPITNEVELAVYDMLGKKIITLVNEVKNAGFHQVAWDASQYASGIFYYQLKAGEFQTIKRMIYIK